MDCSIPAGAESPSFSALISAVEAWAADRDILKHSTPTAQLMKTVSELGELADATLHDDKPDIVDGIGDVLVTLIIYAKLQGVSLPHCLESAYNTIKDRKGRLTASGVFLKESNTPAADADPDKAGDTWALADAIKRSRFIAELAELDPTPIDRPDVIIAARNGKQYQLICTCAVCPEQYDVKTMTGDTAGYLRLRHGVFRADCPDVGGDTVYFSDSVKGDGAFDEDERIPELTAAINAIDLWWEDVRNESRASDTSAR
jgi:NTP pyrophosphatase (non-canonical NTP hydrolase)